MEQKKKHKVNLEKKRGVYAAIGLLMASAIVLVAFEYRTLVYVEHFEAHDPFVNEDNTESLIIYVPEVPKKPKVPIDNTIMSTLIIDDPVEEGDLKITPIEIKVDANLLASNRSLFIIEEDTDMDIPVDIPQIMPEFKGGIEKMYEYLGSTIKYPRIAVERGREGFVYLQFIIEKDGSISNIVVLRDEPGGGCAEEAIRVVQNMPNWTPGSQMGKKVRVKFTLPVQFSLRN